MSRPASDVHCSLHPQQMSTGTCATCGRLVCSSCSHRTVGGIGCAVCIRGLAPATARRPAATQAAASNQPIVLPAHESATGAASTSGSRRSFMPLMTGLLVAICVGVYVYDVRTGAGFSQSSRIVTINGEEFDGLGRLTLFEPSLAFDGEWYRLLTSGFVHFGFAHLALNMLVLWQLGRLIEGTFGALAFGTMFVSGVLGGSIGVLLVDGETQAGGASGAVFALMGATAVIQLLAGQNILRNGMAPLLAVNIAFSFLPFVSLGGHLGGLGMGLVAGAVIGATRRYSDRALALAPVVVASLGFAAFAACITLVLRNV